LSIRQLRLLVSRGREEYRQPAVGDAIANGAAGDGVGKHSNRTIAQAHQRADGKRAAPGEGAIVPGVTVILGQSPSQRWIAALEDIGGLRYRRIRYVQIWIDASLPYENICPSTIGDVGQVAFDIRRIRGAIFRIVDPGIDEVIGPRTGGAELGPIPARAQEVMDGNVCVGVGEKRLLIHEGKNLKRPGAARWVLRLGGAGAVERQSFVGVVERVGCAANLLEVADPLRSFGGVMDFGHRWNQQAHHCKADANDY